MEAINTKSLNNLIGKPETFTGDGRDEKALLWIRQVQRIKKGMGLDDEQILLVIGNNLKGKAEEWWCTREDHVVTWNQFVEEFKMNFAPTEVQRTIWWNELESIEQRGLDTVDDVKIKIEQLCNHLNLEKDNELIIRKFYKALRKDLQYELDRGDLNNLQNWEKITNEARRLELIHKKHGIEEAMYTNITRNVAPQSTTVNTHTITSSHSASNNQQGDMNSMLSSTLQHLCAWMDKLNLNINELKNNSGIQNNRNNNYTNRNNYYNATTNNGSSNFRCFVCNSPDHRASVCPNKFNNSTNNNNSSQNNMSHNNEAGKANGQQ